MAVKKSRKFPGFLIYSQFNDHAFTAAKSNAKFLKVLCKGGVPFLSKQIYRKVLDLKAELHNTKLCCGIPPPPGGHRWFLSQTAGILKRTSCPYIQKNTFHCSSR